MKIYYLPNGKIVQINYDKDDFGWKNTTNNASIFEIDEIAPINKELCIDLILTLNKVDINGLNKYYIQNDSGTWNLYQRDGWIEYIKPLTETI
jgi:hypothetical protein